VSSLERRLERLERAVRAARRPTRIIWSEGPADDGSAEIARRIQAGDARPDDDFIIVRWMVPGHDDEMAERRMAKNVLERNRASNNGG
jgi:hypothetical protein